MSERELAVVEFEVLVDELVHPEGVAWNPRDERVYAGSEDGSIYAVSLGGGLETYDTDGESFLGIALDGQGRIYACDDARNEVLRFDTTSLSTETYSSGTEEVPFETPNSMAFDPDGNLYVTSSDNGAIYRVAPGGETSIWSQQATEYPNGCCVGPDLSTPQPGDLALFVVESAASRIVRIPILPDGDAGDAEVVADLPRMVPDGLAFDLEGDLWVACYRPDRIVRITPTGEVDVVVDDWSASQLDAPTNVAFCGEGLSQLVVACVGDTFLAVADVGAFGGPLAYPEVP
jgi:gluconolactonase